MRPRTGAWLAPKAGIPPGEREANSRLKAAEKVMDTLRTHLPESDLSAEVHSSGPSEWLARSTQVLAARYEPQGLSHAAREWSRWINLVEAHRCLALESPARPLAPALATLLNDVAKRGPSAAVGVRKGLRWLQIHFGLTGTHFNRRSYMAL